MKVCGIFLFILFTFVQIRSIDMQFYQNDDWDYILFVQHWPLTVCMKWMDNSPNNTCTIPNHNQWTVHGLWPTKIGTDGPQFCNSSWPFNKTEISSIEPDLEQYWTNIEANTKHTSFWQNEWKKHGTCAVSLDQLDSEFKYFNEAIIWAKNFSIGNILAENSIVPNSNGYSLQQIHDALKSTLGVNPVIECQVHGKPKMSLISEIRLCFDKSLNLIDCDIDKMHFVFLDEYLYDFEDAQILTDCSLKRPIMYLAELPPKVLNNENEDLTAKENYILQMESFYRLLQFLIWLTL